MELAHSDGLHRVYNRLGKCLGAADRLLAVNCVVFPSGLLTDLGVTHTAIRGQVVSVWGFHPNLDSTEEDLKGITDGEWEGPMPESLVMATDKGLYSGMGRICTAGVIYLSNGAVYCHDASSIPEQ